MEKKSPYPGHEIQRGPVPSSYERSDRNDFERLPEPPYEKNISELGASGVGAAPEKEIRVYRYTEKTVGRELQIRSAFQLIFVIKGGCTLNIQGKQTAVGEGGILFISRGIPHTLHIPEDAQVAGVILPTGTLKRQFNKIVDFQSPVSAFISNSLWGDVTSPFMLFHKLNNKYTYFLLDMLISEECYPSINSKLMKCFILMTMIGYLSSYTPAEFEMSPMRLTHSDQIPKILNFINDNYRTVTLENLAKHFHYTVPYVSKLIRAATGMTFTSILRETKFDVCRSLLINSDLKIYQIAEIAGYQNTDHFNRTFKKRTGLTPSDYKKSRLDI